MPDRAQSRVDDQLLAPVNEFTDRRKPECVTPKYAFFLICLFDIKILLSWRHLLLFDQLVAQSCPTLCNPMNCSTSALPVLHYLLEFSQTHVHWVGDTHPTICSIVPFSFSLQSFPGSGSFPVSQLLTSGEASLMLQHQSFQWIVRVDLL